MNHIEKFEQLWKSFTATVNGKLITYSKNTKLSGNIARLILTESSNAWSSEYDACGRWLMTLSKEQPEKAKAIEQLLTRDITFTDVVSKGEWPLYLNIALSAVGAGVGWAISYELYATKAVQWLSALGSAAITYLVSQNISKMSKIKALDSSVQGYMQQLTAYHDKVVALLQQ